MDESTVSLWQFTLLVCMASAIADVAATAQASKKLSRCVPLTSAQRSELVLTLGGLCPLFAPAYKQTDGVLLLGNVGNVKGQTNFSMASYMQRLTAGVASELRYLGENKRSLVADLSKLHWRGPSEEAITYKVEMMLCTSLLPVCTLRRTSIEGVQQHSESGLASEPVPSQSNGTNAKSSSTRMRVLPVCRWICRAFATILEQITRLAADRDELARTSMYQLLHSVGKSCGSRSHVDGQYVHCLNLTDTHGMSVVEDIFPNVSADPSHENGSGSLSVVVDRSRTYSAPRTLCFSLSFTDPDYFVNTSIQSHWSEDIQLLLHELTTTARLLVNASSDLIPVNGSLMPLALACESLVFSDKDVDLAGYVLLVSSQITLAVAAFAFASFLVQWHRMRKYPMNILLFLNLSTMLCILAFSIRFYLPGGSKSLICHSDGSLLMNQPRLNDESAACNVQFVFSYYFLLAGCSWWACLAHSWHVSFTQLKRHRTSVSQGLAAKYHRNAMLFYHLLSWGLPLLLLIPALASRNVAGLPVYGFCMLAGGTSYLAYFIVPQSVALLFGFFYMLAGMRSLWNARRSVKTMWASGSVMKKKGSTMLRNTQQYLVKIPIYVFFCFVLVATQVSISVYETVKVERWQTQFSSRLKCLMLSCQSPDSCPQPPEGEISLIVLKIISIATMGFLTCCWAVFSKTTWSRWAQLLRHPCASAAASTSDKTADSVFGSENSASRSVRRVNSSAAFVALAVDGIGGNSSAQTKLSGVATDSAWQRTEHL